MACWGSVAGRGDCRWVGRVGAGGAEISLQCGHIFLNFPAAGSACSASRDLKIEVNSAHLLVSLGDVGGREIHRTRRFEGRFEDQIDHVELNFEDINQTLVTLVPVFVKHRIRKLKLN